MKRFVGLAIILAVAMSAISAPVVSAHATLVESDPADGSVIPETPDEVRLIFDVEIDPELTTADLLNNSGSVIASGEVDLNDPDRRSIVIALPEDIPPGEYTATFVVVEADEPEQHEVEGEVHFSIDPTATPAATQTVVVSAPEGTVEPESDTTASEDDDDDDGGIGRGTLIVGGVTILVALAVVASIGRRRFWR